jgi:hypothetical protein
MSITGTVGGRLMVYPYQKNVTISTYVIQRCLMILMNFAKGTLEEMKTLFAFPVK